MPATAAKPRYTLGTWGWARGVDGNTINYLAPVYDGGNNNSVYWVEIKPDPQPESSVLLWKVQVMVHGGEVILTKLKETATLAKGWAERWVEAL